ncbi:SPT16-domain-containing protein [Cystobasidium minutum MCA 4210]|uniref:SPT16-domain-containing protein n=1 Tax=Cystobasidium minutum MCA 4210 TaxID=1397322 RepID=UPI0034CE3F66|eukprot:jgi/Rhomi1/160298/estExt_Genewise1Plus.C_4_t10186
MSEGINIDAKQFYSRLNRIRALWKSPEDATTSLDGIGSILLVSGASDEDNPYRKTTALQTWLLGYEFPSVLSVITPEKMLFVMSSGKAKYLNHLLKPPSDAPTDGQDWPKIEILGRAKDEAENKKFFQQALDELKEKGTVGTFSKDKFKGKFVDEWNAFLKESNVELDTRDVGPPLAGPLAVKDDDEITKQRCAAEMSIKLMNYFTEQMSDVIENDKKITHEKLAEQIEGKLDDGAYWAKFRPSDGSRIDRSFSEWCYSPIIQSNGNYDLKSSAQSDDQRMKLGVILCSLGVRYKSYCSNVGRTFMIDPHETQESNYMFLLSLQTYATELIKEGAIIKDVYNQLVQKIRDEKPDLEKYFVKTAGFTIGIEFRESSYVIGPKCNRPVHSDMIFSLSLGFQDIPDPKDNKKTYSLLLLDTIKAGTNGSAFLSQGMKSKNDTIFYFDTPEDKSSKKANGKDADKKKKAAPAQATRSTMIKSRLRNENREQDAEAANKRREHQRELFERRREAGLERFSGPDDAKALGNTAKRWKRFESYPREAMLPDKVKDLKIMVDHRRSTVLLPINGFMVPFHINTLKSAIKQEEGDYTVIRFMFVTPGQITGKKEDTPFEDANANFIRGITYRSTDSARFSQVHKDIMDLKKTATKRDNERAEMADVIEQDSLIESRKPVKLPDTSLRPQFEGKRSAGDVEIHQNGIRWTSHARSDHKVDILYSNIKHWFFQPCDHELIVLCHAHLKSPIMIGKKKTKDVTFVREVSEASFDETGNKKRRRRYDEDEIEDEQEELRHRARLNKEFKSFADKVADASNGRFDVDIPFRELGFGGVPFRSNVLMQPSTDCLVFLSEAPTLVITLAEVEIAHLERVQYGLRNFDLVFVMQDFKRPPIHINAVPAQSLEEVKDWLDSVDIPFSEGPVNLNWPQIMKTVTDDPYEFYKEGGWDFLTAGADGDGDSDEESSAESAFDPGSDVYDESDSETSFSEDASESDESEELSDEGEDWSEQEEKAAKSDKKKAARSGEASDSGDDRKKGKANGKSKKR